MSRAGTWRSNTAGRKGTAIDCRFMTSADPVQVGFVASLNRPGGNLTGVTSLGTETNRKRLQLLHELLPKGGTIAALVNPTSRSRYPSERAARGGQHTG